LTRTWVDLGSRSRNRPRCQCDANGDLVAAFQGEFAGVEHQPVGPLDADRVRPSVEFLVSLTRREGVSFLAVRPQEYQFAVAEPGFHVGVVDLDDQRADGGLEVDNGRGENERKGQREQPSGEVQLPVVGLLAFRSAVDRVSDCQGADDRGFGIRLGDVDRGPRVGRCVRGRKRHRNHNQPAGARNTRCQPGLDGAEVIRDLLG
jgi:hypothetical protein